ncbi:hypothetical protein B0H10DRAFT_2194594 [Mycena sp. CBHHK59/15]|nr:hypothetical protein B0H10DRAFT_2194594 [Mycena sp. CBHHK59/15]
MSDSYLPRCVRLVPPGAPANGQLRAMRPAWRSSAPSVRGRSWARDAGGGHVSVGVELVGEAGGAWGVEGDAWVELRSTPAPTLSWCCARWGVSSTQSIPRPKSYNRRNCAGCSQLGRVRPGWVDPGATRPPPWWTGVQLAHMSMRLVGVDGTSGRHPRETYSARKRRAHAPSRHSGPHAIAVQTLPTRKPLDREIGDMRATIRADWFTVDEYCTSGPARWREHFCALVQSPALAGCTHAFGPSRIESVALVGTMWRRREHARTSALNAHLVKAFGIQPEKRSLAPLRTQDYSFHPHSSYRHEVQPSAASPARLAWTSPVTYRGVDDLSQSFVRSNGAVNAPFNDILSSYRCSCQRDLLLGPTIRCSVSVVKFVLFE